MDYLVLEDLLVDRIKETMPELKAVLTATDLAAVKDDRKADLAVHVVYLGDEIGSGPQHQGGSGKVQAITQQWMVVLVVKFAGSPTTGKGNRKLAGPLITKLLKALAGWEPPNVPLDALRRINAPKVIYNNGFAYYPFAFKTQFTLGRS